MNERRSSVVVTHRYAASAERVFDAWLDPERARRFLFATEAGTMVAAEIDARVGGRFRFVDRRDGEDVEHVGEYVVIERPRRLTFDFAVPRYGAEKTRVSIAIEPDGDGCRLTLTQEGVPPDFAARTEHGWGTILAALAKQLA
jgi:uncharacterized protein YndB with AHSA1/START domain